MSKRKIEDFNDNISFLSQEILIALAMIKKGLKDLKEEDIPEDMNHITSLLLSSGFERLIKCILCIAVIDNKGNYLENPDIASGRKGHDLKLLLGRMLLVCENKKYLSKFPALEAELKLLSRDSGLRKIINHLGEFAQGGRYYSLDMATKGKSKYQDPYIEWLYIGGLIYKTRINPDRKNNSDEFYSKRINEELIIIVELFTRALIRIIVLSGVGDIFDLPPTINDFLFLSDDDLGKTKYL